MRSICAGAAGTPSLTLAYAAERRARHRDDGRISEPWASAVFGGTLMSVTLTLFSLLGRTPPPWRWPPDVIATSVGTHVAYVAAVAGVDDGFRRVRAG